MSARTNREVAGLAAAGWKVTTETLGQRLAAAVAGWASTCRAGWSR